MDPNRDYFFGKSIQSVCFFECCPTTFKNQFYKWFRQNKTSNSLRSSITLPILYIEVDYLSKVLTSLVLLLVKIFSELKNHQKAENDIFSTA